MLNSSVMVLVVVDPTQLQQRLGSRLCKSLFRAIQSVVENNPTDQDKLLLLLRHIH